MRLWQGLSLVAFMCGAAACGGSGDSASGTSGSAATAGTTAPSANTANLDAVMSSAITQNYLTAAAKNSNCAADANAVMQIVQTLGSILGDANLTASVGANASAAGGNVSASVDANTVVTVFEQDLPKLQVALATLQQCVQSRCGDHNMGNMPSFPCGKPGSTTFPHGGDANSATDGNRCSGDDHHHPDPANPRDPNGGTSTGGTTTAGVSTGAHGGTTTGGTTTVITGNTTAGTTTGSATGGTTTAGTTTGGTTGTATAGTTTGGTTSTPPVSGNSAVIPADNSCIGVVYGGHSYVACGVDGLQ